MKQIILITASILFSILFYQQDIGLNLSLFSILTVFILLIKDWEILRHQDVILKMSAYLLTGVMVFFYHSTLVILANILSFFTLIGSVSHPKTSLYINWLNGIYTSIASYFSHIYDRAFAKKPREVKKKINYFQWLKIVGIPILFTLIFIALYKKGNPIFHELIEKIDLSFINIHWLFFTLLGYYLFYNVSRPIVIEPITTNDLVIGNYLSQIKIEQNDHEKLNNEKQLGLVLLGMLIFLIIIFLSTDVYYLSKIYGMTAAELSKQVHYGVNALIISNLLAIAIILYFFRGKLNFYKYTSGLKKVSLIWIFLNLIVVISTFLKNLEYIQSFGLTYKRIGVIFFLIVTSIGLITTYFKVLQIRNMWFLFRKNFSIAFIILVLSSTINWDKLITYYNLNVLSETEINYVIGLSNNNTFQLYNYSLNNQIKQDDLKKIEQKYEAYLQSLEDNTWQEYVFDNTKLK